MAQTVWTSQKTKFPPSAYKNRFVLICHFGQIIRKWSFFPTVFVSLDALVMMPNEYKTFLHPLSLIVFRFQSVLIKAFPPSRELPQ